MTRFAPLKKFFKETLMVIATLADERDYRKITNVEKNLIKIQNEQPFEKDYRMLLTNFAFTHLKSQIAHIPNVEFSVIEDETAFIFMENQRFIETTTTKCTCEFVTTMQLPCKHILSLLQKKEMNLFEPTLCNKRWYKSTVFKVVPFESDAGSSTDVLELQRNPRALRKEEKFKKLSAVLSLITENVIGLPQALFDTHLHEFEKCMEYISKSIIFSGK